MNSGENNPNSKLSLSEATLILDQWFSYDNEQRSQYGFKKRFWRRFVLSKYEYSYENFIRLINGNVWKSIQNKYSHYRYTLIQTPKSNH